MKLLKFFLSIAIVFSGLFGDYVVFRSKYGESQLFRATADSIVHATIGFLSALLFFAHRLKIPFETCIYFTVICTVVSALIDVDHVFVAKSIYLKDLVNLKHRGIFHCTTFFVALTTILGMYSIFTRKLNYYILSYVIILAFTSHHLRDGNRRGLWMYPFGHTRAINNYVYVILSAMLPYLFAFVFKSTRHVFDGKVAYMLVDTV